MVRFNPTCEVLTIQLIMVPSIIRLPIHLIIHYVGCFRAWRDTTRVWRIRECSSNWQGDFAQASSQHKGADSFSRSQTRYVHWYHTTRKCRYSKHRKQCWIRLRLRLLHVLWKSHQRYSRVHNSGSTFIWWRERYGRPRSQRVTGKCIAMDASSNTELIGRISWRTATQSWSSPWSWCCFTLQFALKIVPSISRERPSTGTFKSPTKKPLVCFGGFW